jgi:hypothetical protein
MMRHGRRATLLVALLLPASATTAHAECAWVLWLSRHDRVSGGELHDIYSAYATRKECDGELPDHATLLKRNGYDVAGGFPGGREVVGTKGNDRGAHEKVSVKRATAEEGKR